MTRFDAGMNTVQDRASFESLDLPARPSPGPRTPQRQILDCPTGLGHRQLHSRASSESGSECYEGGPQWTKDEDNFLMTALRQTIDNPQRSPVLLQPSSTLPYGLVHRVVRDTQILAQAHTGKPFLHSLEDTRNRLHYLYRIDQLEACSSLAKSIQTPDPAQPTSSETSLPYRTTTANWPVLNRFRAGDAFDFSEDNKLQNIGPLSSTQLPWLSIQTTHNQAHIPSSLQTPPSPAFVGFPQSHNPAPDSSLRSPWLPKTDSTHPKPYNLKLIPQRKTSVSSSASNASSSSEKRALLRDTEGHGLGLTIHSATPKTAYHQHKHVFATPSDALTHPYPSQSTLAAEIGPTLVNKFRHNGPHANATNSFENYSEYIDNNYGHANAANNSSSSIGSSNGSVMSLSSDPFLDTSKHFNTHAANVSGSFGWTSHDTHYDQSLDQDFDHEHNRDTLTEPVRIPGLEFGDEDDMLADTSRRLYRYSTGGRRYRVATDDLDDPDNTEGNRNTLTEPIDIPGVLKFDSGTK